jgi:hypothetical protein
LTIRSSYPTFSQYFEDMEGLNCWEYYKCGREVRGINSGELGTCPASTLPNSHGTNGGSNSGRYCWTVKGTLCDAEVQGGLEDKLLNCINCSFFKLVNYEQGREFTLISEGILQNK